MAMALSSKQRPSFVSVMAVAAILQAASGRVVPAQTISNSPRPEFWVTDGSVNSMVESCGILYIGGSFNYVGPNTGTFSVLSLTTGAPKSGLPRFNGTVFAVAADGNGGWFVGGDFTSVGGVPRNRVAHIFENGVLDPTWNPNANNRVSALAVGGGTVFVGGSFSGANSIGGQTRNGIAALDAITGAVTAWNPNSIGSVDVLTYSGGILYAGGGFTSIGGQSRSRIAALNVTTGAAIPWNPTANNSVSAIVVSGNTVYVGGNFSGSNSIGGQARNRIAALNATTGSALAWDPNANSTVDALAVLGDTVYAGGNFSLIGGQTRWFVAALDSVTGAPTDWDPNASHRVRALVASGDMVYAAGDFESIGGDTRYRIAALDVSTGMATPWNSQANLGVRAIALANGVIAAGGSFTCIGGQLRSKIAAFDTVSGSVTTWNPTAGGDVQTLTISGSTLYVGGAFFSIGGQSRVRLAALNTETGLATSWNPSANNTVRAIAVTGNMVYVGGDFNGINSIGGLARNYIAEVNATTGLATAWNASASGIVRTLSVSGGVLYCGGDFVTIGGQPREFVAALDAATASASPWNPDASDRVRTLALSGSIVYAGGDFLSMGGQARNFLAALDASSGTATSWDPNAGGSVYAINRSGNIVYVGGTFATIGGQPRSRIAAIDSVSGAPLDWNPDANGTVLALNVSGSAVNVGGGFSSIGAQPVRSLAAFGITSSEWQGGSGVWSDPSKWSENVVPDNIGCEFFNVTIAGATSDVTLDSIRTINSLKLESGAALVVNLGDLNIVTSDGVNNDANLTVSDGFGLIAGATMTVSGAQPVLLSGGRLGSSDAAHTMAITTPITGYGQIDAALASSTTIDANVPGQTLEIGGTFSASSDGALQATSGGTLQINRTIIGSGTLVADGGMIDIPGTSPTSVSGSTVNVTNSGQFRAAGQGHLQLASHFDIGGCLGFMATSGSPRRIFDTGAGGYDPRGCTPPVLNMTGSATVDIGGNLALSGSIDVAIGADTMVALSGDFVNECTSPMTFQWENGPLTMKGAAPQTFELAGQDFGDADPNGFINNFAMGTLRVEAGATVTLSDNFDNISGAGCEVLYVDTIILGAGSTIILDGCNIYYRSKDDQGATINLQGGAVFTSALVGDSNCDDSVSGGDIRAFILAVTDPVAYEAAHPLCNIDRADLDQSGDVDEGDIPVFVNYLLEGI